MPPFVTSTQKARRPESQALRRVRRSGGASRKPGLAFLSHQRQPKHVSTTERKSLASEMERHRLPVFQLCFQDPVLIIDADLSRGGHAIEQ